MLFDQKAPVVSLRVYLDPGRVRGSLIQLHVDWLRQYGARDEIIELFESLNPELRHQVLAAQPAQWYRFSTVVELQIAITTHFAGGDPQFIERIGAFAALQQLEPLRKHLVRGGIHDFFRNAAHLHRESVDFATAEYVPVGAGGGRFTVTGLSSAPSYRAYLAGFFCEAISLHGAADATVDETNVSDFELRWR